MNLEAVEFFERVVDRYRNLNSYQDTAKVVQVTQRNGRESNRVETQIQCAIQDGKINVLTPGSQLFNNLGLEIPIQGIQSVEDSKAAYDLWIAPHMAMKFADKPLKKLRAGVEEGFTPTTVERTTIDNRPMMHVELRSGDGLSEDCTAKFDLYVNSDSMLIERIEGQQRLPDGAEYSTTVQITPTEHEPLTYQPAIDSGLIDPVIEEEDVTGPILPDGPPTRAPRT